MLMSANFRKFYHYLPTALSPSLVNWLAMLRSATSALSFIPEIGTLWSLIAAHKVRLFSRIMHIELLTLICSRYTGKNDVSSIKYDHKYVKHC